jgi:hypothetical protein
MHDAGQGDARLVSQRRSGEKKEQLEKKNDRYNRSAFDSLARFPF